MTRPARNLLVTGGAGFIGANFCHHWCETHATDSLVILDALTYAGHRGHVESLESLDRVQFVAGDIRDRALLDDLLQEADIDVIVNFAAESHVDNSINDPGAFLDTNIEGVHQILEAARTRVAAGHATHVHQVSTDEVFGDLGPEEPAFHEGTPYRPSSPYSASKAAADHLVNAWARTFNLSTSISWCSNNYGPRQHGEKLIPKAIYGFLYGREVPVYGTGENVRDWLFVRDHCRAIEAMIERAAPGARYAVGGNAEHTNIELLNVIAEEVDARFAEEPDLAERFPAAPAAVGEASRDLLVFVSDRPGHDRRYAIDCSMLAQDLGIRPSLDLRMGLRQTIDWYIEHHELLAEQVPEDRNQRL